MAKIQINDVKLDGNQLFNDSETFLNELKDNEMEQIVGGLAPYQQNLVAITSAYFPSEEEKRLPLRVTDVLDAINQPVEPVESKKPTFDFKKRFNLQLPLDLNKIIDLPPIDPSNFVIFG
ncbi:MAG: hypothetical protein AAFW70_03375 [Cyanobacteria bacterium J06635_10]